MSSLSIGAIAIQASSSVNAPGYVIDGSRKSISLRGGFGPPVSGQLLRVGFANLRGNDRGFGEQPQSISVSYTAGYTQVPFDVEMAVRQQVALTYKRRGWIGQRSQSMANGAGTVSYESWEIPPSVKSVLDRYSRNSFS